MLACFVASVERLEEDDLLDAGFEFLLDGCVDEVAVLHSEQGSI